MVWGRLSSVGSLPLAKNSVVVSMRMRYMCAFLFRRFSVTISLREYRSSAKRERRARESVHRRRLCDQESARLQRPPRNQLDVVCGTGLYRLGGTFLGLYQVRRVAGESDEDREVRLQALRTKILAQYHWNLW